MPPYRYSDSINPYVQTIAETMGRKGEALARGRELAGQTLARGQELSGQAWANGVQGIAQAVQGGLVYADNPQRNLDRQRVQANDAAQADRQSMDRAFSPVHPMGPQEEGTPSQLPTREQILSSLPGHLQGVAMKQFADADENAAKVTKARREYVSAMTDDLAGVRWTLEHWQGDPTVAKLQIDRMQKLYADDPAVLDGLSKAQQAIEQDPTPANILKIAGSLPTTPKYAELSKERAPIDHNPEHELRSPDGTLLVPAVPKPEKPVVEPKAAPLGSFEDYVGRKFGPNPTAPQIEAARKAYAVADNQTPKVKAPVDVGPDVQTTRAGRKYVDLSGYTGEERNRAREAANKAGVVAVSKEQASALQDLDTARANQQSIMDQIGDMLPKGAAGRIALTPITKLEQIFQTDEQKAAFGSWRTAAIQTLRATAGSKGLRINQAEIALALENDIPKLTDTYKVAQQKVKNVNTLLENAEAAILVRDRSAKKAEPLKVGGFTVEIE